LGGFWVKYQVGAKGKMISLLVKYQVGAKGKMGSTGW
jgi:hypothetical protein